MIEKLISGLIAVLLSVLAIWWFYDDIGDHFRKPLIEASQKAIAEQKVQNEVAVKALWELTQQNLNNYNSKIEKIKECAKTLPNTCPADAGFISLLNSN